MLSHTSTLDIITHDPSFRCNSCSGYELSDYERSLLGDAQLDDVSDLQAHLQFLSDAVNSNLQAAINLERLFHEVNSKMMYVAPYIRSIIQAASGPDIQYISSYPLAVNPCLIHDPLLCVFPQYGSVTGIACVSIPSPFVSLERSTTQATKPSEVEDNVDSGEESPMDAEEWLARGAISSSSFEDGQASVEPPLLDYSFLARLTSDISEAMTPLALVCIARSQDLYGAMASCLHQRWAWDITEPLMGIALDDSTSSVRLVFGWLLQSIDDSTCFTMHIVHGFYGAYDLSIATDAKNFALSVASACRRFAVVSEKARAYTSQLQENIAQRKLNAWRLDQIGLAAEIANDVSLEEKIDLWRLPSDIDNPQALFSRNGKCDVKTRGRRRRSHSSSSSPPTMDMDARPAKKIKKVKSEPCRMTITHSIQEDSVEFTLMQTPPPAVDGAVGVDFRSASSLAAGGNDPDKTRPMKYWLYNHLAVPRTLAFPAMLKKHLASDVEQRITQEYYSLTTFGWLDDKFDISDDLKALPLVRAAVAAVAQVKLLAQLGQSSQYVPLTGQSAEVLQSSLWEVVSALEDIQRLRVGMDQASELECRHHIDRLMLKFFHGHKDGSTTELSEADYVNTPHVMVSLERSLALPRGCVAHIVDDPESLEEARTAYNNALNRDSLDIVPLIRELSLSSVPANPTMVPDPATQSSLRASAMNRTTFQQDIVLVRKAADLALARYTPFSILNDQLTLESQREPERAVCDSVGYIRFPSIFTSITASSSFNMIQTSKSHTPSQKRRTTIASTVSARSIREQAMGRPLEMNDSDDIFATAQNFSGTIKARQAVITMVDVTVEGDNKHSLPGMTVQTGGHEHKNKANIDLGQDFFFPILLAEHKKRLQIFFATSINQGRLYATASVRFYAAMDVYDVGVYTIVSEGSVLVVTVSYAERPKLTTTSTLPPLVNILERNTVSFNLAEPLGLLNFVTFLIKLRIEYVPQVLKRVASVMGESSESIAEYLCSLEVPIGGPVNEAQWRHYRSKQ